MFSLGENTLGNDGCALLGEMLERNQILTCLELVKHSDNSLQNAQRFTDVIFFIV